jgi:peroxiredoxin
VTPRLVTVAATFLALALFGAARADEDSLRRVDIGRPAPLFSARGADGRPHRLADYAGKVVVLEWTSPVCPYTEIKYKSGAMQALQRQARRMGAAWLSIDTAAADRLGYLSPKAAKARIRATHSVVTAFLSDPAGKIGRAYGAKTTPTLYIIGKDGRLAYQGALDDDPSSADFKGKTYVRDALDDLAAGRPVRVAESRTYGCAVEY